MFSALPRIFVIILLALASQALRAEKTDVVYLQNGDRITGEVKSLFRGKLERNDQLGINLRALVGAGYDWVPVRNQRNWLGFTGGLNVNREIPTVGDSETNLEATGGLFYEYFKFDNPERSFRVDLTIFPSLTDFGRWRANLTNEFKLEFVDDLFLKMDIYANYDSDPISSEGSSSDYGVTSSLGYKF